MLLLIVAGLVFIGLHVGVSGTRLRGAAVARLGEGGFRGAFSLATAVSLVLLILAFHAAPTTPLWYAPAWLRILLMLAMAPAFLLFVTAIARGNPTAVGGSGLPADPHGIQRITRHPMLWSFSIWATVHLIGNGDSAALAFFGTFLVTALAGMPSIDAKIAARDPVGWQGFAARTSILPFAAILAGRNRWPSLAEIGWLPPVAGLIAWLGIMHLHPMLFGVPILMR